MFFSPEKMGSPVRKPAFGISVNSSLPGPVKQSVASPTVDPGVLSLIMARSHTFMEIDHEIISTAILLSLIQRRVVVSYKQEYVQEVLVNGLVKFAQEKVWLGELTVSA